MAESGGRLDRVVAVVATFRDGREQIGSGYLVGGELVLTAAHCTWDKQTQEVPSGLRVIRATDGAGVDVEHASVVADQTLDVAVVPLVGVPWESGLTPVVFAGVNRTVSGMLTDCAGIGFPLFQRDPSGNRDTSEFHGTVYQTDEAQSGRLLMREPLIHPGPHVTTVPERQRVGADPSSSWGGLSGAVAFYKGQAVGVVVEHHPRQGDSAIRMVGFDRVAADSPEIRRVLNLPEPEQLPLVTAEPLVPLAELVDIIEGDDFPTVFGLNPYLLGATPTHYGDRTTYGERDPYVARTSHHVDTRVQEALQSGRLVLLVGPSKAGKTRTAFEAVKAHWPQARLLAPTPTGLRSLFRHPRVAQTRDGMVVWLDDLQRFLSTSEPLTPAMLERLQARPGPTVVVATLRSEERARLRRDLGELVRETRLLLEQVAETTVELAATSDDPDEQAAAQMAYPDMNLSTAGLAEELAGAPALLQQYRDARHDDPILHAVLQTAIDWARVEMPRPIETQELTALALELLFEEHPELEPDSQQMIGAVKNARKPPLGAGRVAALRTVPLPDRGRGYRAFDYLVATDDGQSGTARPVPSTFWIAVLDLANPVDAFAVSVAAYQRNNIPAALFASRQAAAAGHTVAMVNLGYLLADRVDPPELVGARHWYEQAAAAGHTVAMFSLGFLLANRVDPPDVDGARHWYEQAAAAGDTVAMVNLGNLLANRVDPPDVDRAWHWYEQAAAAGHTDAMEFVRLIE